MRIVVKNLPETASKAEIETHFALQGSVTDVYMLVDSRNRFRRVCFIGYSSSKEAEDAVGYFNGTYFKNHKITVEIAHEESDGVEMSGTKLRRALYSKTIVIKNVGRDASEDTIAEGLSAYGAVEDVQIEKRKSSYDGSIVAIARFKKGEDAEKALKDLRIIAGRRVKVGNYVEKLVDMKKEHYNSLFFNFETVIKRTCEAEKIDRNDLLNLGDRSLGSRIALLETSLVAQTKTFLENSGIFLDRISGVSESVLILRNSDLMGVLDLVKGEFTVSIAPSKCLALLAFKNPSEASRCYKELNMRRFKNEVIYCEFAPASSALLPNSSTEKIDPYTSNNSRNAKPQGERETNKIIVKNVPFQATQEELRSIFSFFTHVLDVRLPRKPDGAHRGFAFIVLDSPRHVDETIEYFSSSTHLYGRRLVLERAKS